MGSTEACYLGGLAMKKQWQARRREAGLPADRPNIVFSHVAQVCWQKVSSHGDTHRPAFMGTWSAALIQLAMHRQGKRTPPAGARRVQQMFPSVVIHGRWVASSECACRAPVLRPGPTTPCPAVLRLL